MIVKNQETPGKPGNTTNPTIPTNPGNTANPTTPTNLGNMTNPSNQTNLGNTTNPSNTKPGSSTSPTTPTTPQNTTTPTQGMFTVIFDGNGGTVIGKNTIVRTDNQQLGSLPIAQRKGYSFRGWYLEKAGGGRTYPYTRVSGSRTVYAQWQKIAKPKKAVITSLKKRAKGKFTVKYRGSGSVSGYEICYSTNKKFKSSTKKVYTYSMSRTVKGLRKNKTYYVRVSGYQIDSTGSRIYGSYSKSKKVKV